MSSIALLLLSSLYISTSNAAGAATMTVAVDSGVLVLNGSNFPANGTVAIAITTGKTARVSTKADSGGKFLLKIKLSGTFSGTLKITATSGGYSLSTSIGANIKATTNAPKAVTVSKTCVAPTGAALKDWDKTDQMSPPWPHVAGKKTVVYFATSKLSARSAADVAAAAKVWSLSPCISAIAIANCPAGSHCVTMTETTAESNGGEDGQTRETFTANSRIACSIVLYHTVTTGTAKEAILTITHEMGHALGLSHRISENDLMTAVTSTDVSAQPDSIDYYNLLVIYGK